MYDFTFTHDSDHFSTEEGCNEIEITVSMSASEDDHEIYEITCFDLTADCSRTLESFPLNEKSKIESVAEKMASDKALDAYQDRLESEGDRAYEEIKDRDLE